jgi:hypothetical protein
VTGWFLFLCWYIWVIYEFNQVIKLEEQSPTKDTQAIIERITQS